MSELIVRFLIGGVVVSAFALCGELFKPKTFAGLFGAAPSVALSTLALTMAKQGTAVGASEAKSMILGAAALGITSLLVWRLTEKFKWHALLATSASLIVWFAVALGAWALLGGRLE